MHAIKHIIHMCTSRVISLIASENSHVPRIWTFQQRPSIKKIVVPRCPSMLPSVNDLVPKEIAKTSHRLPSMTIQLTYACLFTSNDGASYQTNGKIATSKGGGKEHRPFEQVGRSQLLACSQQKTFLYTNTLI